VTFTNKQLKDLIIPLIIEQLLVVLIGMADTVMVASVGEAAVSGVSLVDTITVLINGLLTALATAGAVVVAQYIGKGDPKEGSRSAKQLIMAAVGIALIVSVICLPLHRWILNIVYGNIEADVMGYASIYFLISILSYPFLALYNCGAALFRGQGNSKISMKTGVMMNVVNVIGNAVFIYGFSLGSAGAALGSLIARMTGAIVMLVFLKDRHNAIYIDNYRTWHVEWKKIKTILTVGIPNAIENSMFQIGKILVAGMIASYGTASIAANAVANNVTGMEILPGNAIGIALLTVVGQCAGAGDYDSAKKYIKLLMKWCYEISIVVNVIVLLTSGWFIRFYNLEPETASIAVWLINYHAIGNLTIWPLGFTLPSALRGAGDVRFTLKVSASCMWACRIGLSYVIGTLWGFGVKGVWVAMSIDWVFRSIAYVWRLSGEKWKQKRVV